MESRVERAVATFEEGFNCCQSVFCTYAELFGMDRETALKLSCSMGAGIGRMREVCGTVCAMALLAGLKTGNTDPLNQAAKTANYELVRRLADAFGEEQGSIICREILGIRGREKSAAPSPRTKEYYRKRPCCRTVACASWLVETILLPELFGETENGEAEGREAQGRKAESGEPENREARNGEMENRKPESGKVENRKPESGEVQNREPESGKVQNREAESGKA